MLKIMNKKTSDLTCGESIKFATICSTALLALGFMIIKLIWKWDDIVNWFKQRIHRNDVLEEETYEEDELK